MTKTEQVWPVVAGVDGTEDGERAALYAAELADQVGRPLTLIHAYRRSPALSPLLPIGESGVASKSVTAVAYAPYASTYNEELMRDAGDRALRHAETRVRARHPHLVINRRLTSGSPAKALVKASRTAATVVLVRSREHAVERFLAGSTTSAVAFHATAPVVVVPTGSGEDLPIDKVVVGLEGLPSERDALAFAFEAASWSTKELQVVHATRRVDPAYIGIPDLVHEAAAMSQTDKRVIAESLAGWGERYPDVHVKTVHSARSARAALLHEVGTRSLLVVGARAGGGFKHLALGSTARAMLNRAPCPVAVVHASVTAEASANTTHTESAVLTGS